MPKGPAGGTRLLVSNQNPNFDLAPGEKGLIVHSHPSHASRISEYLTSEVPS